MFILRRPQETDKGGRLVCQRATGTQAGREGGRQREKDREKEGETFLFFLKTVLTVELNQTDSGTSTYVSELFYPTTHSRAPS